MAESGRRERPAGQAVPRTRALSLCVPSGENVLHRRRDRVGPVLSRRRAGHPFDKKVLKLVRHSVESLPCTQALSLLALFAKGDSASRLGRLFPFAVSLPWDVSVPLAPRCAVQDARIPRTATRAKRALADIASRRLVRTTGIVRLILPAPVEPVAARRAPRMPIATATA